MQDVIRLGEGGRLIRKREGYKAFYGLITPRGFRQYSVTLWRQGAVAVCIRDHFVQLVLGDWWRAMPRQLVAREQEIERKFAAIMDDRAQVLP